MRQQRTGRSKSGEFCGHCFPTQPDHSGGHTNYCLQREPANAFPGKGIGRHSLVVNRIHGSFTNSPQWAGTWRSDPWCPRVLVGIRRKPSFGLRWEGITVWVRLKACGLSRRASFGRSQSCHYPRDDQGLSERKVFRHHRAACEVAARKDTILER